MDGLAYRGGSTLRLPPRSWPIRFGMGSQPTADPSRLFGSIVFMGVRGVTEDKAKTKWCPMARTPEGNRFAYASAAELQKTGVDAEYIAESVGLFPCIGSACMAWRTVLVQQPMSGKELLRAIRDYRDKHDCSLLIAKAAVEDMERRTDGYCGLAGPVQ